ncbi:MAG: hypothetical protein Q9211_002287 [Gyalolechia sp. 1 TL-2023]
MATMDYETENGRYDEEPRYDRDRSASPRPMKRDDDYGKRDDSYRGGRDRSASPNGRVDSRGPAPDRGGDDRDAARNPGSNLFVTGIHPRLNEADVTRLFEKYGDVEGCSIMKDPHTQESRGFGFVKMVTGEQADAAKEGLQGENIEGHDVRPPPRGGRYGGYDRYDDRRRGGYGGGYGGGGRYDDSYRSSRYEDRGYGRRDDYGSRGIDRYASSRDDRYSSRGDDRRGGSDYYSRDSGRGYGGDSAPSRDPYAGGSDDRYSRR